MNHLTIKFRFVNSTVQLYKLELIRVKAYTLVEHQYWSWAYTNIHLPACEESIKATGTLINSSSCFAVSLKKKKKRRTSPWASGNLSSTQERFNIVLISAFTVTDWNQHLTCSKHTLIMCPVETQEGGRDQIYPYKERTKGGLKKGDMIRSSTATRKSLIGAF